MRDRLSEQPLFLLVSGIASASMFVPALHAAALRSHAEARAFFYSGLLGLILLGFIMVARSNQPRRKSLMHNLLALFGIFAILPLWLAVPFREALQTTSFLNAWLEMVSSLTTTGASLFAPERLSDTLHLWRAQVGWLGGLLMWIAAAAVLAPLSLGGFEVTASAEPGRGDTQASNADRMDPQRRFMRVALTLTPIYLGLTAALWIMLLMLGERGVVALAHAMSTLATSGISPVGGLQNGQAGFAGEALVALFLLFALSRLTFSSDTLTTARPGILSDPEFRLGLLIVAGVSGVLFLRHWGGATELQADMGFVPTLRALWGTAFTALSFLTTTGFESADWEGARLWSGLPTPGLLLLALALVGGGVATTAGGVKLLRVWALYLNGTRELDRLIHPNLVRRDSGQGRRLRRKGAFIAWVFFMLFAMVLTGLIGLFSALGSNFEQSTILAISALSNSGPLTQLAGDQPILLVELRPAAKLVLAAGMVLGRLEMLAIIALATSDVWRSWWPSR